MNSTPSSNRFYIGIFGKCNSGKSSLINALTNQEIAIISSKKGTTTDPVKKNMEIPKIGPCVLVDTPGFDDFNSKIGKIRVKKSIEVLNYVNAAILVLENTEKLEEVEKNFLKKIKLKNIPFIVVSNKCDENLKNNETTNSNFLKISAKEKINIKELLYLISKNFSKVKEENFLLYDLIKPKDLIILVVVIDESYPKDRLILPQQQLIYEILKKGGICKVCKNYEYEHLLKNLKVKPKLIVTDSQIFSYIFKVTPKDYKITSFSILLARKKGILKTAIKGAKSLKNLNSKDEILICESCTHIKKSCDIGSVIIPKLIEEKFKIKPNFKFKTGEDFTKDVKKYKLIVHCGGCMTTTKKIQNRFKLCEENNIPITNYGILIAYLNNLLEKSIAFLENLKN